MGPHQSETELFTGVCVRWGCRLPQGGLSGERDPSGWAQACAQLWPCCSGPCIRLIAQPRGSATPAGGSSSEVCSGRLGTLCTRPFWKPVRLTSQGRAQRGSLFPTPPSHFSVTDSPFHRRSLMETASRLLQGFTYPQKSSKSPLCENFSTRRCRMGLSG